MLCTILYRDATVLSPSAKTQWSGKYTAMCVGTQEMMV